MRNICKACLGKVWFLLKRASYRIRRPKDAVDTLYSILYHEVHDLDEAREIKGHRTSDAFDAQWKNLPEGEYLLSDPWFRENVDTILAEHELLLPKAWFPGKRVLDAGCGNGRWSYGFSRLGVDLTSVDINQSALEHTQKSLSGFKNPRQFVLSPLEEIASRLPEASFDLVFCWGVAHHCRSFSKTLANLAALCRPGGVIYFYLYGRESLPFDQDIRLFKERVRYNVLFDDARKMDFLRAKANGGQNRLHTLHDIYAPLINRRFTYDEICGMLAGLGFSNFVRTIEHSEIFVRAEKTPGDQGLPTLPKQASPYWFQKKFQTPESS